MTFCVSLEVEPTPKQQYCFLAVSTLSLHPPSSLISNCLNLPFGTQGKSWRLVASGAMGALEFSVLTPDLGEGRENGH